MGRIGLAVLVFFLAFSQDVKAGCTAEVKCKNGSAFCSASSRNTGVPGQRLDAFCGQKEPDNKFLTCWESTNNGKVHIVAAICCDASGNAIYSGWSLDTPLSTSECVSF